MQDRTEGRPDDGTDWCEFEDLPLETKCKLEGIIFLFRKKSVVAKSGSFCSTKTYSLRNRFPIFSD